MSGALTGLGVVAVVGFLGTTVSMSLRGALLGALIGVLVAPIFAMFSFLAMLWPIPTLEGLLGDSLWSRMATALHQRRLGPLFFPVLIYLVLPMGLFSYGTSKQKAVTPAMLVMAGFGATLLGTVVGGVCGTIAGKTRPQREFPMLSNASPLPGESAHDEAPEWSPRNMPDTRIESAHRR